MISIRIIPCLDVRNGKTTKGIKFKENVDIGDPVEMAREYYEAGADELVFYDITASAEKRGIFLDVVEKVANEIFIPFTVGGGLGSLDDVKKAIGAGAEKISLNSLAVQQPNIIDQSARLFGKQAVVLGLDAQATDDRQQFPSGYQVWIQGGRTPTSRDALEWAQEAVDRGAGEICLNSMDADGTQQGYEVNLTRLISDQVTVPVIASGGAGKLEHLVEGVTKGRADAVLVASMLHYGTYSMREMKQYMEQQGLSVRKLVS